MKICGLTDPDDARAAVEAGADAIGLVHHAPSPRSVDAARGEQVARAVDGQALLVAVLVDPEPEAALAFARRVGAGAVQLCGSHERPDSWREFPLAVWRRLSVDPTAHAALLAWREVAALFVLDHPSAPGGTGRSVDLPAAAELAARAPCLLAGGLDEHNVSERVAAVAPFGVDASSRLERAPGAKHTERVAAFVAAARAALMEHCA